jgi:hypothetical protein
MWSILTELCNQEDPDIDPLIVWVYSMENLLNEHGDEKHELK